MFLLEFWLRESLWSPVFPGGRTLASQKAVNVSEHVGTGLLFSRVVGGSGRVCVCEDYLPSSPSGSGSCREKEKEKRQIKKPVRDFHRVLSATQERPGRGGEGRVTAFTARKYRLWLIRHPPFPHTYLSLDLFPFLPLSVSWSSSQPDTFFIYFFLFISISKTRVLVTQALLFGLQVNHQWMEAKSCGVAG